MIRLAANGSKPASARPMADAFRVHPGDRSEALELGRERWAWPKGEN